MHLDDERIERLIHAELDPPAADEARSHLAGCAACRALVARAHDDEMVVLEHLRQLDHPAPEWRRPEIVNRVTRLQRREWTRWAAGIALIIGFAGGAYAAVYVIDRAGSGTEPARPPAADSDSVTHGVGVPPGARLTVAFSAPQPGQTVTVALTDGSEVMVRAVNGAATFASHPDRLTIDNAASSARFEIDIPSRAPHVEIVIGRRTIFTTSQSRVSAFGARLDARGRYVIPLDPLR